MLDVIDTYIELGMVPCPVRLGSKTPIQDDWPSTEAAAARSFFEQNPGCNVGIVLGEASGGIVDVDLDNEAALAIGPLLLPRTGMRFGRETKQNSHYVYRALGPQGTQQFRHPVNGRMILELRGNGAQTVFPPSIHKDTGEEIRFEGEIGHPLEIGRAELLQACRLVAIGSVVLDHWREGSRHKLSLALAGFLAHAKVPRPDSESLFQALTTAARDEEADDRFLALATTYDRLAAGGTVGFRATLDGILGKKTIQAFRKWLPMTPLATTDRSTAVVSTSIQSNGTFLASSSGRPHIERLSTDLDAADLFVEATGGRLIFADQEGQWFAANNHVHRPVTPCHVTEFAFNLVQEAAGKTTFAQMSGMKAVFSRSRVTSMVELGKTKLRVDHASFDRDLWKAGCENGVLDLEVRELVEPTSILTKRLGTAYDAEATCPVFQAFLAEVFEHDQDKIAFVQRAVGYTLTGRTSEQCLFVLTGSGANGKSTLLKVLHQLMGDYAGVVPMHTLMVSRHGSDRTDDLAELKGKRFVSAQEGEAGQRLAEAKIKLMTGGDDISCRALYKAYETYSPQFKLWLATNELPEIKGLGEATWRRIHVIEFPVTIPASKRDSKLPDRLSEELPGILNWALAGLASWADGGSLNAPESVASATRAYRADSDTVGQFLDVCCIRDPEALVAVKDLHVEYQEWCTGGGYDPLPLSTFGKALTQHGFQSVKAKAGNNRRGLRLKP